MPAAFDSLIAKVIASGETREEARELAYRELAKVTFKGAQHRTDIGTLHFEYEGHIYPLPGKPGHFR